MCPYLEILSVDGIKVKVEMKSYCIRAPRVQIERPCEKQVQTEMQDGEEATRRHAGVGDMPPPARRPRGWESQGASPLEPLEGARPCGPLGLGLLAPELGGTAFLRTVTPCYRSPRMLAGHDALESAQGTEGSKC